MYNYSHKYAENINNKFKDNEIKYNVFLENNKYYVLRLDGVKMTKSFVGSDKNRKIFYKTMKNTIELFFESEVELFTCYSYSDEISFILNDEFLKKYDYRIEKILSIATSKITSAFYISANKNNLDVSGKLQAFDARILEFNKEEEIIDYIIARQAYAISSNLLSLKFKYLSNDVKNNAYSITSALIEKNIFYEQINKNEKFGILFINKMENYIFEFKNNEDKLNKMIFLSLKNNIDNKNKYISNKVKKRSNYLNNSLEKNKIKFH